MWGFVHRRVFSKYYNYDFGIVKKNLFKRTIFTVSFEKKISSTKTEVMAMNIGITRFGPLISFLSITNLYNLIVWDSNPKISLSEFTKIYRSFEEDKENSQLITEENISFGRGSKKKTILNVDGIREFAKINLSRFQFCGQSVNNLAQACISKINKI